MRKVDTTARYSKHADFWIRPYQDRYRLGLSDWGQYVLGSLTAAYDFPEKGIRVKVGDLLAIVETDKATTELHMPVSGKITQINISVYSQASLINTDCYGAGWILELEDIDQKEWEALDSAEAFKAGIDKLFKKN